MEFIVQSKGYADESAQGVAGTGRCVCMCVWVYVCGMTKEPTTLNLNLSSIIIHGLVVAKLQPCRCYRIGLVWSSLKPFFSQRQSGCKLNDKWSCVLNTHQWGDLQQGAAQTVTSYANKANNTTKSCCVLNKIDLSSYYWKPWDLCRYTLENVVVACCCMHILMHYCSPLPNTRTTRN